MLVEYLEDLYPDSPEHPYVHHILPLTIRNPARRLHRRRAIERIALTTRSIFPKDTYQKSWARLNIQHISKKIIPFYFSLQQSQEQADQDEARKSLYEGLRTLADRVIGPYFAGEQWTAVDMSLAPFIRRFYNLEEFRAFKHEDVGDKWVAYKDQLLGESNSEVGLDVTWDRDRC